LSNADASFVRAIGVRRLTASIVNATIGAGIFVLPATVAAGLGPAAPLTSSAPCSWRSSSYASHRPTAASRSPAGSTRTSKSARREFAVEAAAQFLAARVLFSSQKI
jgi:hypothetical protein